MFGTDVFLSDFMIKTNLGFMTIFIGFRGIQGLVIRTRGKKIIVLFKQVHFSFFQPGALEM